MSVNLTRRMLDRCQGNLETLQKTVLRCGAPAFPRPGSLPALPPTPGPRSPSPACPQPFPSPGSPQDQGD